MSLSMVSQSRLFVLGACLALLTLGLATSVSAGPQHPRFRVLVVGSKAKDHLKSIAAAPAFFQKMAADNGFAVDFTDDAEAINDQNLSKYKVFVMFHLAPFDMTYAQQAAMRKFVERGNGWVGIHAAGLTGKEFLAPETKYWQWFEDFMGGVLYSPHPYYQKGTVVVEDRKHPATRNLPERFEMSDEWYEWDKSVRGNARVLATADESTYHQNHSMGDHPVVWTNEKYRRMIYIAIGHDPSALENPAYATLVRDSILWAASRGGHSKKS
jgi:type 1 glutamine amidotransferase